MSLFNGELSNLIVKIMGDSIREPALMDLGNPITGEVDIQLGDGEHPGLVWIHARRGNNQVVSSNPELADDDKETATRAFYTVNKLPDDVRIYGTPVYVVQFKGVLTVWDLGGLAAMEYLYGLRNHPQRSVDISQFDYGLIRPTAPPSAKIMVSPFRPVMDGVVYDIPALLSVDLIETYGGGLSDGEAKAIMLEMNPITQVIFYTAGSAFVDTTHPLAFPNYPHTVNSQRFLLGWVKLTSDMSVVTIPDIYPAQEVLNKVSTGGTSAIAGIVVESGDVVTEDGQVVWEFN